jgi:hypothetical protein
MRPILIYQNDSLIDTADDIYLAAEKVLEYEDREPMDTPEASYAYFKDLLESGDIDDWRLVEDELDILNEE